MQLEAEEHYRLMIGLLKEDKDLDNIAKILYDRKEYIDEVLKKSHEFQTLRL